MATFRENMATRRDAIGQMLADAALTNGQSLDKLSVSVEGESISREAKIASLYAELKQINELIGEEGGPVEVISRIAP